MGISNHQIPAAKAAFFRVNLIAQMFQPRCHLLAEGFLLLLGFADGMAFCHVHGCCHAAPPSKKTTPPVRSDRGRKMHGTTSGAVKPHSFTLRPSSNGSRCIGRTRPTLLLLRADHSGRYFSALSRCLAPPGSSLAERGTPTSSHPCVSLLGLS